MRYFKIIESDYIILVGIDIGGEEIAKDEYDNIVNIVHNCPVADSGYVYKLRTDLTWELCEVPPIPEEDMEATEENYLSALAELGVSL